MSGLANPLEVLGLGDVLVGCTADSMSDAIELVGGCLVERGAVSSEYVSGMHAREEVMTTYLGNGIALPHARLAEVEQVVGAFIRLERPIDFGAADRQPVDLVFVLLAPLESGVDHLKALALVSRTLRHPALCAKLRANHDPATLYALLTESEATQAA